MKKLSLIGLAAFGFVALSATAWATEYKLTYDATTPDGTIATGKLDVVAGVAVGGYLDITAGPEVGDYKLVTTPESGSDNNFIWDNAVFPHSTAFVDSSAGLLWSLSGTPDNVTGASYEINMWWDGDSSPTYSLWGAAPGGEDWNLESDGTASLTRFGGHGHGGECPDGGLTVALLGGALVGLQVLRRKLMA
jgi:hypothetical protein